MSSTERGSEVRGPETRRRGLRLLLQAIEELKRTEVDTVATEALGDELVQLRDAIDRLEAEFTRRLRRFDQCRGARQCGATSTVAWLRSRCRLSAAAAMQRTEIAQKLPDLPDAQAQFESGGIGLSHAAVLARVVTDLGKDAARLASPALLDAAKEIDPTGLRTIGRCLHQTADPEGSLAAAIRDHARRYLHLSQNFDGLYQLDGLLDAEGGAALRTALEALIEPLPGDVRTAPQRRADALVELATRQLQSGSLPTVHGQRPHLVLTASIDALKGFDSATPPKLEFAGPVPRETALRIACDSASAEVALTADGPLSVGRSRRTIPPAIRRALNLRDGGCRFPGCDRPPEWTDAHHVISWIDGGETTLDNLVLLCRVHHRRVHEERWSLSRSPNSGFVARPP